MVGLINQYNVHEITNLLKLGLNPESGENSGKTIIKKFKKMKQIHNFQLVNYTLTLI